MALSNIAREPRREITEQVIGTLLFVIGAIPSYWIGIALHDQEGAPPMFVCVGLGILATGACYFFGMVLLIFMHFLGERACNWLSDNGLELRPRNRR
jgi:apolipoprotein N-acyltransferase